MFIDPGVAGGVAVTLGSLDDITLFNLEGVRNLKEIIDQYECYDRYAWIELVPPFAGKNIPSSTSFKLGQSFGLVEGLVCGMGIPCEYLPPKIWQAPLSGLRGLSGSPRKRALKEHALRIFPHLKPSLKTADAALMAHFIHNKR